MPQGDSRPVLTYDSLDAFYAANETRRRSPEADYGVNWTEGRPLGRWRVSYVQATGEIYAIALGGPGLLIILGMVPPDPGELYYQTLDALLEGWPDRCGQPGGLGWVRNRLP